MLAHFGAFLSYTPRKHAFYVPHASCAMNWWKSNLTRVRLLEHPSAKQNESFFNHVVCLDKTRIESSYSRFLPQT